MARVGAGRGSAMPVVRSVVALALQPVGVALSAPAAAWAVAGHVARAVRRAPEDLRRLALLLERADALLAAVEPPVLRASTQVDAQLIDDLVLSARTAPALVATASLAVGQFEGFVDEAQRARHTAERLAFEVAGLLTRADGAVTGAEALVAEVQPIISAADRAVSRADAVARGAELLLTRVEEVIGRASGTVGGADSLVHDVRDLAGRVALVVQLAETLAGAASGAVDDAVALSAHVRPAVEDALQLGQRGRPVAEEALEVGAQLVDPARVLLPVLREQAPALAALVPDLVATLRALVTELPDLLHRLDAEVVPTLVQLRTTPGDVRALRDTVADIEPLVSDVEAELAGLPGSTLLRRRGRSKDGGAEAQPPDGSGAGAAPEAR
jgi:hypothetical protein